MSTVAEKLSYLADTKDLFKDRLNSLGAEITSSTTFRNYLNWLDTFYGEVSDKTDLSENGVVGRTSQESTTGKNLLPPTLATDPNYTKGTTTTYDSNTGYYTTTGTTTNTYPWLVDANVSISTGTTLTISSNSSYRIYARLYYNSSSYEEINSVTTPTKTVSNDIIRIAILSNTPKNTQVNETYYVQIEKGSTATSFEKFTSGASPNPDYPQPINNLSGDVHYKISGKNLFDTNRMVQFTPSLANWCSVDGIDRFYNETQIIKSNVYYDLKANTTYTFSVYSTLNKNTSVGSPIQLVDKSGQVITSISQNNTYMTFTTTEDIRVYPRMSVQSANVLTQCIVQLEESSTATDFEPYIEPQTFNIPLKSKNLFDKNNFEVFDGYYIGGGGNFRTASNNHTARIIIEPNTTYTISKPLTTNNRLRVGISSHEMTTTESFNIWGGSDTATDVTLTSASDSKYMYIFYAIENEKQLALDALQVEKGSTATTYEPYYDIELCDIDTYEDKIYSSDGRFYLNKNIDKIVLDGSENWFTQKNTSPYVFALNYDNYKRTQENICKCNLFLSVVNGGYGDLTDGQIRFRYSSGDNNKHLYICTTVASTVSDFKTWLSTHNTIVYYVLNTPTTTEITQENYPSLYNALKQIQDYLTAYKINKEFILGYSSPEIEY